MNSFDYKMGDILLKGIKEYELDDRDKVLIITSGACKKAFCAGGDIVSLSKGVKNRTNIKEFI
jgi:enoyl-CoA hydratase/carnithine racemase